MEFLYHGSITQDLKVLEPRKRYTPAGKIEYSAVYATPLSAYAAAHAFPWSSDEGFDIDFDSELVLIVPKEYRARLNVPISIYKVSSRGFQITSEEETGQTWHTTKPVDVLEELKYKSVEEALFQLGGKIREV